MQVDEKLFISVDNSQVLTLFNCLNEFVEVQSLTSVRHGVFVAGVVKLQEYGANSRERGVSVQNEVLGEVRVYKSGDEASAWRSK